MGKICTTSGQDLWKLAQFDRVINNYSPKFSYVVSYVQFKCQNGCNLQSFLDVEFGFTLNKNLKFCNSEHLFLASYGRDTAYVTFCQRGELSHDPSSISTLIAPYFPRYLLFQQAN